MRQLIYTTLSAAANLLVAQGGKVNDVYTANALGTDPIPASPPVPFLVVQEGSPSIPFQVVRKTAHSAQQSFDIRCFDNRGDYTFIDQTLVLVRDILLGVEYQVSPSGNRCTQVRWMGFGPDAIDSDLDLITKSCTMRFVSNMIKGA